MEFYISPETRQKVEHKINLMFKHLENKPTVTFGSVEKVVKTTIDNYGCDGHSIQRQKIQAIHVEIEDVKSGDWTLVATVDYKHDRFLMFDARYFKDIPEQYGLEYTKCDHCGCEHKNRNESHILYNQETGQWMQVGSTCVNKMVNGGKYLNGLMLKLYEVFNYFGGCDGDEWRGGWWRPSKQYVYNAISIYDAMGFCLAYMRLHGDIWKKAEYDYNYKISSGTNDELMAYVSDENSERDMDCNLFNNVHDYFMTVAKDNNISEFSQKIVDAFNNEFITISEMYIAWFAIMNYKNSITSHSFEERVKSLGFEKGKEYNFCGTLENIETFETYDWRGEDCYGHTAIFKDDATGMVFTKDISYNSVIDKFLCKDGKYRFNATIKFIAYKRQRIGFGGRLRKQR